VLLTGAGVMVRSFLSMATADLGIRSSGVTSMLLRLPADRYPADTAQRTFFDRLKARLEVLPGMDSIAIASELPAASVPRLPYELAGSAAVEERQRPTVSLLTIGPGYFNTLDATILSGRDFNDFDQAAGPPVAIVNEAFARTSWPGEEAVGKRLRTFDEGAATGWTTVVGVASHISQNATDWRAHDAVVYRPFSQRPGRAMWVLARADGSLGPFADLLQREVHAIDRGLPVWIGPFALSDLLAAMGNYWRLGANATLLAAFAAIALCLAAIGLYAVVAYAMRRRTQEIGVRIAIGAATSDILRLVFSQGLRPAAAGLALGLAASVALTPVLKSQLVRVSPIDPLTLAASAAILMLATMLGCLVPAWRALRVDPVVTLRHD
jgi:putative ABC transport system permease protein